MQPPSPPPLIPASFLLLLLFFLPPSLCDQRSVCQPTVALGWLSTLPLIAPQQLAIYLAVKWSKGGEGPEDITIIRLSALWGPNERGHFQLSHTFVEYFLCSCGGNMLMVLILIFSVISSLWIALIWIYIFLFLLTYLITLIIGQYKSFMSDGKQHALFVAF